MHLCPRCHSHKIIKNGNTYYGKQNHKCKNCDRQFVLDNEHTVDEVLREIARRALLERISLRGICRLIGVSLSWMLNFAVQTWSEAPDDLGVQPKLLRMKSANKLQVIGLQLDEMWSFVGCKQNKAWIWVIFEPEHRQVIAFHIGGRGIDSMKALWKKIPQSMRKWCYFETDDWEAYQTVLPTQRHYIGKEFTYFIEGFFAEVRARVSRLVRKSLSFSKKWENHIAALKYFFWQFNLEQQWMIQ